MAGMSTAGATLVNAELCSDNWHSHSGRGVDGRRNNPVPISNRWRDLGEPVRKVGGCAVCIWVVPAASKDEITGIHGDRIGIRVSAPANGGRANTAVCNLLAAAIGKPVEPGAGRKLALQDALCPGYNAGGHLAETCPLGPGTW